MGCESVPKKEAEAEAPVSVEFEKTPLGLPPTVEESEELRIEPIIPVVSANVKTARSFSSQAKRVGAEVTHVEGSKDWQAQKGTRTLSVHEGGRLAVLDGVKLYLDESVQQKKGRWLLGDSDERLVLGSIFSDSLAGALRSVKTIVIDPGHGGSENGTTNANLGLIEKNLNLDVSERLQGHLEALGYKVIFTRYDDRVVSLKDRPTISNNAQGDLFISIHFNAALNVEAQGLETYMLTPAGQPSTSGNTVEAADAVAQFGNRFDKENLELAFRIQKSILDRLQRVDRGVRKARWAVLKTLDCPGVLVECGFLSNGDEALLISTAAYRERLALSLANALDGYSKNIQLGEL